MKGNTEDKKDLESANGPCHCRTCLRACHTFFRIHLLQRYLWDQCILIYIYSIVKLDLHRWMAVSCDDCWHVFFQRKTVAENRPSPLVVRKCTWGRGKSSHLCPTANVSSFSSISMWKVDERPVPWRWERCKSNVRIRKTSMKRDLRYIGYRSSAFQLEQTERAGLVNTWLADASLAALATVRKWTSVYKCESGSSFGCKKGRNCTITSSTFM